MKLEEGEHPEGEAYSKVSLRELRVLPLRSWGLDHVCFNLQGAWTASQNVCMSPGHGPSKVWVSPVVSQAMLNPSLPRPRYHPKRLALELIHLTEEPCSGLSLKQPSS